MFFEAFMKYCFICLDTIFVICLYEGICVYAHVWAYAHMNAQIYFCLRDHGRRVCVCIHVRGSFAKPSDPRMCVRAHGLCV